MIKRLGDLVKVTANNSVELLKIAHDTFPFSGV